MRQYKTYLLIGRLDGSGGTDLAVDRMLHSYTLIVTVDESRWVYDIRLRGFARWHLVQYARVSELVQLHVGQYQVMLADIIEGWTLGWQVSVWNCYSEHAKTGQLGESFEIVDVVGLERCWMLKM
jgi:hypothetical protein